MKRKNFSKSEAEMVDVMDTLHRAISIIEKEIVKNLMFLQKEIDTRNTNNTTVPLITKEDLKVNSFQRTTMMMSTTEQIIDQFFRNFGTLITVENAHNTADTKYSVYPVAKITVKSKDGRDSIRN